MSSTRKAKDDSVFHQNRYASSPEFERGLLANLVAKRCSAVDDAADRELIWFVQYLSHQPGGIAGVAQELIARFSHRLGTPAMIAAGKKEGVYTTEEVLKIRAELPPILRDQFPLRGEANQQILRDATFLIMEAERADLSSRLGEPVSSDEERMIQRRATKARDEKAEEMERANKLPTTYPAKSFLAVCREVAEGTGTDKKTLDLQDTLRELCLDPAKALEGGPWYFAELVDVLREYQQEWVEEKSKVVVTALGRKVCDTLEYCEATRTLALLEGNPRMGKSFSARTWCEQHPGKARFVEVATGNDETSFFRELARGLGLGNFLNYKALEIRDRVESVLRTGDILLVLDEAQRLWPQRNLRYGYPSRVVWVMAMAEAGVPICLVSTPQFIQSQNAIEKAGWNSAQLTGRIGHYELLPADLTLSDLKAVGRSILPEASEEILDALASYARISARYLAAVDSIAKRAKFIAQRGRRTDRTAEDVRAAMKDSIIPSDTSLARNLEAAKKTPGKRIPALPNPPESFPDEGQLTQPRTEPVSPDPRKTRPAASSEFTRRAAPLESVET